MRAKIVLFTVLALLSSINAIRVSPGENITEGNCGGQLEYFLCNCTALNTTIDIHFSPGQYHLMRQDSCLLQNKTSIKLIGSSSNDTIIECKESFNIVFMGVRGVIISNITMVNCGNVVNDSINQTVYDITYSSIHFGSNFKFAIMFYQVKDITITDFTMDSTAGYGIVAFNAVGNITISKLNVHNTFPKCDGYDYDSDTADFNCSGSGLLMIYHDSIEHDSVKEANTTLIIAHSNFTVNRNYLPYNQLINTVTGFYENNYSVPLQGAAGITIFYLQNLYDVNTTITNSLFHNNNGTLSASIAIVSLSTRSKTLIQNSSFSDSNRVKKNSFISSDKDFSTGGISYYYLSLMNRTRRYNCTTTDLEVLTVINCSFTKLGGALGAAFHIEKVSVDATPLHIRIEQCNFSENEANVGSAVYAVDRKFKDNLTNGLTIDFVNVSAENNALLPGYSVESSSIITGVFHSDNCHFKFDCIRQCNFTNNQPSVFYGRSAYFTISGKARFFNNTSRHGGALRLLNTVTFIHQESDLYFYNNHAIANGGAINIFFFNTNIQSQDICPIQFIGHSNATPISHIKDINETKVNITFETNTAGPYSELQSIYANVFYVCTWYSYTLTQIYLGKNAEVKNGTRQAVYNEVFSFIPDNKRHLSILGYLPCPCDENKTFDAEYCLKADLNNTLKLGNNVRVIVGRSFTVSLVILDVVGSIGYSKYLYSQVSSLNTTNNILMLHKEQLVRPFSVVNRNCTPIDFTIYSLQPTPPNLTGVLHLSLPRSASHNLHFSFDDCPIGFSIEDVNGLYACTCGEFFNKSSIKEDFQCNSASGKIRRIDTQSWLSVNNNRVEYTKLCLPEYCNTVSEITLTDVDVLCKHKHTGRACGACEHGFSKTFGSKICQECCNIWLVTILLYGILGIILVLIIHLLKLTVTMGTISGLIFFCNVMSINENLFFNTAKFSFIRIFISLINLDLGFEMCFYKEMSEIDKTGLQFVFPLYLWLLMFIIIMIGKHYMRSRKSTHSAVPVLATLILLSYSKILRTTISVFSFVFVYYSNSDFSGLQQFVAWQPDPNIKYLEDKQHIGLFLVALVFTVLFILPLAFALTFPKVVLRSKKLSYFFPLLDCIYAPYKNHCRFWFGIRTIILIYFSGMESILLSYSLLLSGVLVILLFALMQACIHPFKSTINNTLDLMFKGVFIALSIVVLYLDPSTSGNKIHIAVNALGGVAFLLFCFIIIFHLHDALMYFSCYLKFTEALKTKFNVKNLKGSWNPLLPVNTNPKSDQSNINENFGNYAYLQESLLEEQFN